VPAPVALVKEIIRRYVFSRHKNPELRY
jgi:hypothetical protein